SAPQLLTKESFKVNFEIWQKICVYNLDLKKVNMKLGIIREGKVPPDSRVPLIPEQCVEVNKKFGWQVIVQPSPGRCYDDSEFLESGIRLSDDLNDCDILLGVKEVPTDQLIPGKTYLFFSHTIKEQ